MKFIIFYICMHLVYSEFHTLITTYTGITGQKTAGIPEFFAVTSLDGQQLDYYDSIIKKMIPKQNWMKDYASTEMWTEDTEIRKHVQQIYRNNIQALMQRFSQSHAVHTYQRMYGCEWDDETGDSHGFDQYGYDGEDFILLDLKESRYITPVPQGIQTMMKWNNDIAQLKYLKQYYNHECVYWLKRFLHLSKATVEKTDPPKVSLLQKKQDDYVDCQVTGFPFRNTIISWRKNGQAVSDYNKLVKSGETLPNEDGTFQRTVGLHVYPDDWKKNEYTCVVEHKSLTETIQKTMAVKQIKRNITGFDMLLVLITITVFLAAVLCVLWKQWKELVRGFKYFKPLPHEETKTLTSSPEPKS